LIKSLGDPVSIPVLRNIYFTKFECILKFGIIFWGWGVNDSNAVFKIEKKGLRLIKGGKNRASFRNLFGDFKILTATSLYIIVILCFIKMNKIYRAQYSDIHTYNTKGKQDLYVQLCSTARCKKV
jgi:hypothetical protein